MLKEDKDDPRTKLTDGSIGNLLYATLKHIGGWKSHDIFIERLPTGIVQRMQDLYKKFDASNKLAKEEWEKLMHEIIGSAAFGSGAGGGGNGSPTGEVKGIENIIPVMVAASKRHGIPARMMIATWQVEWPGLKDTPGNPHYGWFQMQTANNPYAYGPFSHRPPTLKETHDLGIASNAYAAAAAGWGNASPSLRNDLLQWTMKVQGVNCGNNPRYCDTFPGYLQTADKWISKYGDAAPKDESSDDNPTPRSGRKVVDDAAVIEGAGVHFKRATSDTPSNKSDAGDDTTDDGFAQLTSPVKGLTAAGVAQSGGGAYGAPRPYPGGHAGVDVQSSMGQSWHAICDGKITASTGSWTEGTGCVILKPNSPIKGYPENIRLCYGGTQSIGVSVGDEVTGGQQIAKGGSHGSGPHLHFFVRTDDTPANGTMNPTALVLAAVRGGQPKGGPGGGGGGGGGGGTGGLDEMYSVAKASAFAAQLEWPTMEETIEAVGLQGQKSLMNDKPLMPFVQQLTNASLRQFQSMPNGDFFGFYPDYFGEFHHRKPYWYIDDIEILDGRIQLTDDSLATHVYVVGDTLPGMNDYVNKLFSAGVINIFNVFGAEGLLNRDAALTPDPADAQNPKTADRQVTPDEEPPGNTPLSDAIDAVGFLQRYGARPSLHEEAFIRSPYFEAFMAYQTFMLLWSRQFLTTFTFTFMPELYPGGHVGFPDHGLQMYIDEVEHSWDYESGFTTTANLSAPAVLRRSDGTPVPDAPLPENMMMALVDGVPKADKPKKLEIVARDTFNFG